MACILKGRFSLAELRAEKVRRRKSEDPGVKEGMRAEGPNAEDGQPQTGKLGMLATPGDAERRRVRSHARSVGTRRGMPKMAKFERESWVRGHLRGGGCEDGQVEPASAERHRGRALQRNATEGVPYSGTPRRVFPTVCMASQEATPRRWPRSRAKVEEFVARFARVWHISEHPIARGMEPACSVIACPFPRQAALAFFGGLVRAGEQGAGDQGATDA